MPLLLDACHVNTMQVVFASLTCQYCCWGGCWTVVCLPCLAGPGGPVGWQYCGNPLGAWGPGSGEADCEFWAPSLEMQLVSWKAGNLQSRQIIIHCHSGKEVQLSPGGQKSLALSTARLHGPLPALAAVTLLTTFLGHTEDYDFAVTVTALAKLTAALPWGVSIHPAQPDFKPRRPGCLLGQPHTKALSV